MTKAQQSSPWYFDATCSSVVKIVTYKSDGSIDNRASTGFLVKGKNENFLVTNYHVVPGMPVDTRFVRGPRTPPHTIELWHFGVPVAEASGANLIYKVHPDFAQLHCDIAAIPIGQFRPSSKAKPHASGFSYNKNVSNIETIRALSQKDEVHGHKYVDDMFLPIGRDVTVFGFPGGIDQNSYPIGVNTKIASDAYRGHEILVSGGTYKGCSGGPAVARSIAGYQALLPKFPESFHSEYVVKTHMGSASIVDHIIGIYAGRKIINQEHDEYRDTNDNAIQVGVIWKFEDVIRTIFEGIDDND